MLFLTRNVQDETLSELFVGPIRFKIMSIYGDYVKIGIDAPRHFNIIRRELVQGQNELVQYLEHQTKLYQPQQEENDE